jgi:hypothetical protein
VGFRGGMALFRGYEMVGGLAFFWGKGNGFFSQEKEKCDILGNFGHFLALKVP